MAFYVLDENNNKVEAFDKEGVLSLLEQAIQEGTLQNILADSGFISKIKCCVSGITNKIAFVSQTTYNQLKADELLIPNAWYFITDDTEAEDIDEQLKYLNDCLQDHNARIETLENNFSNGVANKARITNLTNEDVETKQGLTIDTRNEEITDVLHMWVELKGITYNLGLVRMPPKASLGLQSTTTAHSSPFFITRYIPLSEGYSKDYNQLVLMYLEITCNYNIGSDFEAPYYTYNFKLMESTFETSVYYEDGEEGDILKRQPIILEEKKASEENYKIYWRPIK